MVMLRVMSVMPVMPVMLTRIMMAIRMNRKAIDGTDPLNPFSCSQGCFSFDIDADEKLAADALTDGLLVIRHLFGFSGDALIAGATSTDATRQDATEITSYLNDAESELDIEGDGEAGALADGLILIR